MPKIKKNKIEQCTKIFIYRDLNQFEPSGALRLVKICEMIYTWTCALSSPILLITILIARIESLRGPERIICMGPYGPKTTKADYKEFY